MPAAAETAYAIALMTHRPVPPGAGGAGSAGKNAAGSTGCNAGISPTVPGPCPPTPDP